MNKLCECFKVLRKYFQAEKSSKIYFHPVHYSFEVKIILMFQDNFFILSVFVLWWADPG